MGVQYFQSWDFRELQTTLSALICIHIINIIISTEALIEISDMKPLYS